MPASDSQDHLLNLLLDRLDRSTAHSLAEQLQLLHLEAAVSELLVELKDVSSKIQGEAVWALGEIYRRGCLQSAIQWLDLGITLSQASGALGLRYFKESPLILGLIEEESQRNLVLTHVLELADGSMEVAPQCAYEWLKVLPQLCEDLAISTIQEWAQLGMELAEWNYVLGSEFFRESPSISKYIPLDSAKAWIGFGMKLMVRNSFGKPDYMGTLEFFRSSPRLFQDIAPSVKSWIIHVGSNLADYSPEQAMTFLAKSPELLARIPSVDWQIRVLKFGLLIADRDAAATLAYFHQVPEVAVLTGKDDASDVFDSWFAQGMEALEYNVEAGRAFFGLETRQACLAVEEAMSGVSLRQVARSLKMFATALSGEDVVLESIPEPEEHSTVTGQSAAATLSEKPRVNPKDKVVYLPLVMRRSDTREGNRRWYSVMVAHEVGHLEFGTYALSPDLLQRMAGRVTERYDSTPRTIHSLGNLFHQYPQPGIIRDLFEIVEDARVDFLLRHSYPGLEKDLSLLTKEVLQTRTLSHGMTAREIVLDALLLLFAGYSQDDISRPGLQEVIDHAWATARTILHPLATVNDAVEMADRLYQQLDDCIGTLKEEQEIPDEHASADAESPGEGSPEGSEHVTGTYQPLTNWAFRGVLNPEDITGGEDDLLSNQEQAVQTHPGLSRTNDGQKSSHTFPAQSVDDRKTPHDHRQPVFGESPMQQWFQPAMHPAEGHQGNTLTEGQYLYEEWDGGLRDYRPRWCRVHEQPAQAGSPDFVDETFHTYGPIVRLIRRYFETIRPEAFRRIGRQAHGEEIDFDALVNWMVDRRRGNISSDQVYSSRHKCQRQVAVAFLVDMSGSTGRQIGSRARPVIEIEKEGLLLLSEALTAIGDQFAMYGFSGQSRHSVDIQVIKDFEHQPGSRVGLKISGVQPRQQNRDGAAIRHVSRRLLQQPAKVRLLILISDGKPLDDEYADEYSLEDTKMALREARLQGIHPFCITIDQTPTDYVKRMYGEIGYVVVDEVDSLPTKLPRIYQRLTTG